MEALNELCDFLKPDTRLDVKTVALHHLLSMTGHIESRTLLLSHPKALNYVIILAFKPDEQKSVSRDAFFTLINLSADELDANVLINKNPALVRLLVEYIVDENSRFADTACAVLSNLSRGKKNSEIIFRNYLSDGGATTTTTTSKMTVSFDRLLQVFSTEKYNKHNNTLDYLAPFICNLTQLESVRQVILDDLSLVLRLLPYTTYMRSTIRRGGIVGSIKNLCFNYDLHESLLKRGEVDILSRLLLPLAGPEEFDSDEMDKLPEDLQYLPPDKEREPDPDVRVMLIETIMMLTSHGVNRQYIRDKNAYVILRELHKWEQDENAKQACEKLVHILISDEPDEASMRDLHHVTVPDDLAAKFYKYDELEKNFE